MSLWVMVASVGLLAAACDDDTPTGPDSITSITVTPDVTLQVGETQQFTAEATDQDGNIVSFVPEWSVVAGGGSISTSGLFTAGEVVGTFNNTVQASHGTISGTATVEVVAGPLASIEVTPNPATVGVNQTEQFSAVGRDDHGNAVEFTPTWEVVNGGGTIDSASGVFTAGEEIGTFDSTVQATSGTISQTATVEVVAGPLASIEVTPNPVTVTVNETEQFTAEGRDELGNLVEVTPTWAVVNGGGAIDSVSGLFTAGETTGTFNNTVQATITAISGTATVEVITDPPPASPLGSAANFGILAGTGINCAISGSVTGASTAADIGSSPTTTITGFGPCTFDGSIPETAVVETAKGDLTTAYLAARNQVCDGENDLSGIDLDVYDSSNPLPPGTYCFTSSAALTGTLELAGSATDTWTFQIGSTLTAGVGSEVILSGGAIPDNVYWAVGSSATLNTNAAFQGNIMAQASITLQADVSLLGRALAQDGAVDLVDGGVSIVKP